MNEPLCKYCDKPMTGRIDDYDIWYMCSCEGYEKEQQLYAEIKVLEDKITRKRIELAKHKDQSSYNRTLQKFKQQLIDFENKYEE